MVNNDAFRNFELTTGWEIARGRLQEEERFLWRCITQFLYMGNIVSPNCNYLPPCSEKRGHPKVYNAGGCWAWVQEEENGTHPGVGTDSRLQVIASAERTLDPLALLD